MGASFRLTVLSLLIASMNVYGEPRKGISYKPTPSGGRACYIDGVFAYELPKVPKGFWGSTYGVRGTPVLQDGPLEQQDWSEYLRSKGITFPKGASAMYYPAFGHLVVVNLKEQHTLLLKLIGVTTE